MTRVLLINPVQYDDAGKVARYELGAMPPANVLTVAGIMESCGGVSVRVVDEFIEGIPFDGPFDLVGVSANFTSTFPRAADISRAFRQRGIPVIMGGTHVTCDPDSCAPYADALVIGEAENNVEDLIADFQDGRALKPIYRQESLTDLGSYKMPMPAYHLVDMDRYMKIGFGRRSNYLGIETSRGCPAACDFCCVRLCHGGKVRCRPIADVIEQIRFLKERHRVRYYNVVDDDFLFDVERSRELLAALAKEDIRFFCEASTRIAQHPELLPQLKKAGCVSLFLGFESISPESLRSVNKRHNRVEEYRELLGLLDRNGVPAVASFMLGMDHDHLGTFDELLRFLSSVTVRRAMIGIVTPFPGTAMYRRYSEEGRIFDHDLSHYDGRHVVFRPASLTPDQLYEGWSRVQRELYSFGMIGRRLRKTGARDFVYALSMNLAVRGHVYHNRAPYHSGINRIR